MSRQLVETYYFLKYGAWFVTEARVNGELVYSIHISRVFAKRFMSKSHAEALKFLLKDSIKLTKKSNLKNQLFQVEDQNLRFKLVKVNVYAKSAQ